MKTNADVARDAVRRAALRPGGARDRALAANPPPAELRDLAGLIGPRKTLELIEAEGGTRTFVPKVPNQGTPLSRAIGLEAARIVAEARCGEYLRVPLARAWRVRIYRMEGETHRNIARRLGITESQVEKLLRDAGMTRAQRDLFDV
jgi:hypothetical protein